MIRRSLSRFALPLLVILGLVALWAELSRPVDVNNSLQIIFLDVGQGDAVYLRSPEGQTVLIDGGRPCPASGGLSS